MAKNTLAPEAMAANTLKIVLRAALALVTHLLVQTLVITSVQLEPLPRISTNPSAQNAPKVTPAMLQTRRP